MIVQSKISLESELGCEHAEIKKSRQHMLNILISYVTVMLNIAQYAI